MKAVINGIEVQGTPQEIVDYQKVMDDMRRDGVHIKPPLGKLPAFLFVTKTSKCPNHGKACYCTGACQI